MRQTQGSCYIHLNYKPYFSSSSPPMSSRLPLELFVSVLSCSQRRPQTSHTCFSHQMSRRRRNWRHFRVCLAICPPKLMVKGHSESMSERKGLRLTRTCRDTRIERKLRGRNDGMIVSWDKHQGDLSHLKRQPLVSIWAEVLSENPSL